MPDTQPIRVPSSSQRVASPPRRRPKPADPCAMVIFGAGGDLTKRLVKRFKLDAGCDPQLARNSWLVLTRDEQRERDPDRDDHVSVTGARARAGVGMLTASAATAVTAMAAARM